MCGIVGISAETNVAAEIYDSLLMLQHRGQDAAGMALNSPRRSTHACLSTAPAAPLRRGPAPEEQFTR